MYIHFFIVIILNYNVWQTIIAAGTQSCSQVNRMTREIIETLSVTQTSLVRVYSFSNNDLLFVNYKYHVIC